MADAQARRLADEQAIRDVLHRYALGIDRRDPEMVRSCFVADVEAEYGGHALPQGVDGVLRLVAGAGGFVSTMHHAGTVVVTALAEDMAETEHYAITDLLSREVGGHSLTTRGVQLQRRLPADRRGVAHRSARPQGALVHAVRGGRHAAAPARVPDGGRDRAHGIAPTG